jgi:2'-5' RNA ligase
VGGGRRALEGLGPGVGLTSNGQSAVVVPVPAAEPVVGYWRERYDASAAQGMPAHVTALYPFLPEERLTREVVAALRELCAAIPAQEVRFRRTARFPAVLYLEPAPAAGLRSLTLAIAERWPEAPPYGGRFDEVVPHLTVANGVDDEVLDDVDTEIRRRLPVTARLVAAALYVSDGERWRPYGQLPFQASSSSIPS